MSVAELKEKLITQIKVSDDIHLLEDISRLIEIELRSENIFQLNEAQISSISEARTQIANGEVITQEQADHEIDEWLKK